MSEEVKEGWKCPICKKVWAPDVKSCPDCAVSEETKTPGPQLLLESGGCGCGKCSCG